MKLTTIITRSLTINNNVITKSKPNSDIRFLANDMIRVTNGKHTWDFSKTRVAQLINKSAPVPTASAPKPVEFITLPPLVKTTKVKIKKAKTIKPQPTKAQVKAIVKTQNERHTSDLWRQLVAAQNDEKNVNKDILTITGMMNEAEFIKHAERYIDTPVSVSLRYDNAVAKALEALVAL